MNRFDYKPRCKEKLCNECHEIYVPTSRNQKYCVHCTNDGSRANKNMSLLLQGYLMRLERELDSSVIHLDPVAYEMGIRRVI